MWLVPLRNSSSIACSWCLEKSCICCFCIAFSTQLTEIFSAFCSRYEGSTIQNPFSAILILHVTCTQRNPAIAAFHCMCLAHYETMLLLVKHCMMLTLCSLQNPCAAVFTLHAAQTEERTGQILIQVLVPAQKVQKALKDFV